MSDVTCLYIFNAALTHLKYWSR